MALRSLDEINREFMFESISPNVDDNAKTILVEEIELPQKVNIPQKDNIRPLPTKIKAKQAKIKLPRLRLPYISWPRITRPRLNIRRQERGEKRRYGLPGIISSTLFYLAILVILVTAVFAGEGSLAPKTILGYSYYTILTPSMQEEIPQDSLILVRQTEPQNLQVGDNITYLREDSPPVTHKIVNIYENYEESGARGFQTQGVNNEQPDISVVYAENVVGKVVVVLPLAGAAIMFLRANIQWVFILFVVFVGLSFCIQGLFIRPRKHTQKNVPEYINPQPLLPGASDR